MLEKFYKSFIAVLAIAFFITKAYATTTNDQEIFQKLFHSWTHEFNKKRFPEVCNLFSKSITADYQGSPKKNYAMMCNGFRRIFQETDMIYHNDFKIHKIFRSANLAAIRITWYLNIYKNGVHISSIQEEGIDILQKQANNQWKIVNFIAYPTS